MADSTSNLPLISASQASKEVTANALFDAMSANALFGRNAVTSAALTWGYLGGKFQKPDGTLATIANGTVTLTASATNYLYVDSAGAVQKVTAAPAGWPAPLASDAIALYAVVTDASAVTSYTDYRAPLRGPEGPAGADGGAADIAADIVAATGKTTPVDADLLALVDSAASNVLKKLTWANLKATLKTYFDTLYATVSQPFDVHAFYPGVPSASAIVLRVPVARAITFADEFAGSYATATVAATGSTVFDVQKNGSSVGSITFSASGTTGAFTTTGGTVSLAAGDILSVVAPGTADATLANVGIVLAGTR